MVGGELGVGGGGGVVEEEDGSPLVGQRLEAAALVLAHGEGAGGVLHEGQVNRADHDLAGADIAAQLLAQYFFG